jgi:hypothetical protein
VRRNYCRPNELAHPRHGFFTAARLVATKRPS